MNEPHFPSELCFIDSGIRDLKSLSLIPTLQHLNLHCNLIKKIENLDNLKKLKYLDLSSNQIQKIEGLDRLENLQTLNLSCNHIERIEGLVALRKLLTLNLSYNKIHNLTGLREVKSSTHNLQRLDLYGNQVNSLQHTISCLIGCGKLRVLILSLHGDGNPISLLPAYKPNIFAQLPKLEVLDGEDRNGRQVDFQEQISDTLGLDEYLQWLEGSNGAASSSEDLQSDFHFTTPKIDEALGKFRVAKSSGTATASKQTSSTEKEKDVTRDDPMVPQRLEAIEKQINSLLTLYGRQKVAPQKDSSPPEDSRSSENSEALGKDVKEPRPKTMKSKAPILSRQRKQPERVANMPQKAKVTKQEPRSVTTPLNTTRPVRDPKDDETHLMLIQELEVERERRWKAEQAAIRLVDTIKELQEKLIEDRKIQEAAIATSVRIKQALASEKEARISLEKTSQELEVKAKELEDKVQSFEKSDEDSRRMIKSLQETATKAEKEKLQLQTHQSKLLQDSQARAAASRRETELLQVSVKNYKEQISQLQELLASREQEHKTQLQGMVKFDSKEVRDTVDKELAKQEGRFEQLIHQYVERLNTRNREYAALEDEFRMGLQLEANRFNELQEAYKQISDERSELKLALQSATQKEAKASSLVGELTSMVKELKARLSEISKSKQEMQVDFKERISSLEAELADSRRQTSKIEPLQQDKSKLTAQIRAQESVIEGLRTERKLWGHELAQQGASLAQDRGKMEAKIESLSAELTRMKQQNQEDADTVKIKTKLIEDQTDTIKRMKQALSEYDTEVKRLREEALDAKKILEEDLDEEKRHSQELQDAVDSLTERKEQLKSELNDLKQELARANEEIKTLKSKWDGRSQLIRQLEEKVIKMKDSYESKERKIKEERDDALKSANSTMEKLKSCDDAFRRELEVRQRDYDLEIRRVIADKDTEIDKAKQRVLEVEEEMRVLLQETALTKRNLEAKMKHLNKAFVDMQQDLAT